jgi:hypothetical protein
MSTYSDSIGSDSDTDSVAENIHIDLDAGIETFIRVKKKTGPPLCVVYPSGPRDASAKPWMALNASRSSPSSLQKISLLPLTANSSVGTMGSSLESSLAQSLLKVRRRITSAAPAEYFAEIRPMWSWTGRGTPSPRRVLSPRRRCDSAPGRI